MTDKDLINAKIGTAGGYDIAFTGGKIVFTLNIGLPEASAALSVSIGPKEILDMIAAKVGGPIPVEVAKFLDDALSLQ